MRFVCLYNGCFNVVYLPLNTVMERRVLLHNVRARHRDGIVIEHSGYQLHIITDSPPDTVVSELTRLFLDVFADPN